MNFSRSILGAILTLTLATGVTAQAADKTCVESFKNAKVNFETKMAELNNDNTGGYVVVGLSAIFGAICLFSKVGRIVKGVCGGVFTGTAAAGGIYSSNKSSRMNRLHDAYRLYQIYEASSMIQDPANAQSAQVQEAQKMMRNLEKEAGRDSSQSAEEFRAKLEKAPEQFAALMEIGKFCEGGLPAYSDAMRVMKEWLHAPTQ